MAQNVFEALLNKQINTNELYNWFYSNDMNGKSEALSLKYHCSPHDFITFLINYIHEELSRPQNALPINKSLSYPLNLNTKLNSSLTSSSTPKLLKINSDTSLKTISPISHSFSCSSTPKKQSSLVLGDFLVTRTVSSHRKKNDQLPKRRIKPTEIKEGLRSSSADDLNLGCNSFNFKQENTDFESKILTQPLKEEELEEANLKFVSNHIELELLVEIYVKIIKEGLVVISLSNEICFLFDCLNQKWIDLIKLKNVCFFGSIHNVVFFVSKVLEAFESILLLYDKSTLKLLIEHSNLINFAPNLIKNLTIKLNEMNFARFDSDSSCGEQLLLPTPIVVTFNSETDNKPNFPNDNSFYAFRKQRDLFYEILRQYNQCLDDFEYERQFHRRIRQLFDLSLEPINYAHFSRLFKTQLLNECIKRREESGDRIDRLTNRCVTRSENFDKITTFGWTETFFVEFIKAAANVSFNKHLIDTLVQEIVELMIEEESLAKKYFRNRIEKLLVLAKFLAYLDCCSYKSGAIYSKYIQNWQVETRKCTNASFDILGSLLKAKKDNKLVLFIPFLTFYILMLDQVAWLLPYYQTIFKYCLFLYKTFDSKYNSNKYLIKFSLGFMLETVNYIEIDQKIDMQFIDKGFKGGLDNMAIIDQSLLYICCPFLENAKKVLLQTPNVVGNQKVKTRHIKPYSTEISLPSDLVQKKLQLQLENAFFVSQPSSVQKTIDFISERVASACIKHICTLLMPDFKQKAIKKWKLDFKLIENDEDHHIELQKNIMKTKAIEVASKLYKEFINQVFNEDVIKIYNWKITKSVDGLMGVDLLGETKRICEEIARRNCRKRIEQWLNIHVTTNGFLKDLNDEINRFQFEKEEKRKKPIFVLSSINCKPTNVIQMSPSHLLQQLTDLLVNYLENELPKQFSDTLTLVLETFKNRCDFSESIYATICTQVVDLTLIYLSCDLDLKPIELNLLKDIFVGYYTNTNDLFKQILSPRNVKLFTQRKNNKNSWLNLAQFSIFLIDEMLMTVECFEEQSTGIFRHEWDEMTLRCLSTFFKTFLKGFKGNHEKSSFTFVLSFLSDYCNDL